MKNIACSFLQMVIVRHKSGLFSDNKKEKFSCSNSGRVYYLSQKFCTCVLFISAYKSVYENFFSLFCPVDIKKGKPGFSKHVETKLFYTFQRNISAA